MERDDYNDVGTKPKLVDKITHSTSNLNIPGKTRATTSLNLIDTKVNNNAIKLAINSNSRKNLAKSSNYTSKKAFNLFITNRVECK